MLAKLVLIILSIGFVVLRMVVFLMDRHENNKR